VLQAYGLRDYFGEIIESAVVGVRKPDPEIWRLGVRALGINAEEVLVVGDSYTKDILPALAAGCRAVWIKGKGWTDKEDAQTYPDTISCIADLISKCPNLIYTICGLIFQSIPVRSEREYKHIRLNDKPEAAKKKPQIG